MRFILVCLIAFILPLSISAFDFYDQVAEIHYDETTFTEYNNIDRTYSKHGSGYALGHTTLLSFYRDGEILRTITIKASDQAKTRGMKNDIWHIEYLDKDRVWIISGFGRHFSNAVLYNTLTDENDARYSGKHPLISPDKKHVAYRFPSGHIPSPDYVDHVFIDDVMVYPELAYDMTLDKMSHSGNEGSKQFYKFLPKNLKSSWVGEHFSWSKDGNTLNLLVNEEIANGKDDTHRRYKKIRVHIDETATTGNLKTSDTYAEDRQTSPSKTSRSFSVTIDEAIITELEYNKLTKATSEQ